jgi:alpha-aminoadipate carrier protein LysW
VGYCPECEALIDEEFEEIGEVITCPECGVDLEVVSLDPVEFDLAPVDEEDDDEDEYDYDEEDEDEEWDEETYTDEDSEDDDDEDEF